VHSFERVRKARLQTFDNFAITILLLQFYNYNFTVQIYKGNFITANLQVQFYKLGSLNHRANACSCYVKNYAYPGDIRSYDP
jgi:hypothetical protein